MRSGDAPVCSRRLERFAMLVVGVFVAGMLTAAGQLLLPGERFAGGAVSSDDEAVGLLARARVAAGAVEFVATVYVGWRSLQGTMKHDTVRVSSRDGVVLAGGCKNSQPTRRAIQVGMLDQSPSDRASARPDPGKKYDFTMRPSVQLRVGERMRPATAVDVRVDGERGRRERLVFDDQTHLLLERVVYDERGEVEREVRFTSLELERGHCGKHVESRRPKVADLKELPDGFRAPKHLGAGFVLVSGAWGADGRLELLYEDGLVTLTMFEQRGEVDWDALSGGWSTSMGGHDAYVVETPGATMAMWSRDDVVYSCVTDAPRQEVKAVLASIPSADDDDLVDQLARFVTSPFSWD